MSILAGTNTVLLDNPELTNRLWIGHHPVKLIVDMHLRLPISLKIFNGQASTIIFNTHQHDMSAFFLSSLSGGGEGLFYYQITNDVSIVHQILNACYQNNIGTMLCVKGKEAFIQCFTFIL